MDDLEQDLVLMFDNACRYNEPDSQVYKVRAALKSSCVRMHVLLSSLCRNLTRYIYLNFSAVGHLLAIFKYLGDAL